MARRLLALLLRLARLAALAAAIAAGAVIVLRRPLEDALLYHPTRELEATPAAAGLPFSEVALTAEDGVSLHAWHVRAPDPRGLVLLFHGNGGNVGDRVVYAELFAREGLETLLLSYRGYGRSGGSPSEEGLYHDAAAARRWARDRGLPVVLFGESLGGAVAVESARREPPAGLVLQATFTSLAEMADRIVPFGGRLVSQRFASLEKIGQIAVPLLVVHGDRDELVPHEMGRRLFEAAAGPKGMLLVPGGGHNDLLDHAGAEIARRTRALVAP